MVFSWCRHGHHALLKAALERGMPVDVEDEDGNSLLAVACQNGHRKAAKALLRVHADVNQPNLKGNTPLHFCYTFGYGNIAQLLLSQRADPDARNVKGYTPAEKIHGGGAGAQAASTEEQQPHTGPANECDNVSARSEHVVPRAQGVNPSCEESCSASPATQHALANLEMLRATRGGAPTAEEAGLDGQTAVSSTEERPQQRQACPAQEQVRQHTVATEESSIVVGPTSMESLEPRVLYSGGVRRRLEAARSGRTRTVAEILASARSMSVQGPLLPRPPRGSVVVQSQKPSGPCPPPQGRGQPLHDRRLGAVLDQGLRNPRRRLILRSSHLVG